MKPEYVNTLSDEDDLYIRININKETLKENDNNHYSSSNTNNRNNNNNMSYYSSALSLEKDLYSSSKNEFNLIESQINKIISSNQSFSSKISSSIPSKSVQSDDFKSKISKLSTDFLFDDDDDDNDNDNDENDNNDENDDNEYDQTTNDDNENFVGIDLDSVVSSDHSYLKTIKKLLKKTRETKNNGDNDDEIDEDNDDDDDDDEEEEEEDDDDENEDNESDESQHSYDESQQMNFNSNLSLITDSTQNSNGTKKKIFKNKNKKRKNTQFDKESLQSATSIGNQTYSQYSLSGLSSQSTIKSLIAKNKLLMEIEKLKELNSKLSKSSISNNNEPITENAVEESEANNVDDDGENYNVVFSMAGDQITNISSPRKSDYEKDNITVREQIDSIVPVESVLSTSTIKKKEKEQLLEDLKSLSSLNNHRSIKSKSKTGSPKRTGNEALNNKEKIDIRIIQDDQEDKLINGNNGNEKLSNLLISSHNIAQKLIEPSLTENNDVYSSKTMDNYSKTESIKNKPNIGKKKEYIASSMNNNNYSNKNNQKSSRCSENKIYSKTYNNENSDNLNIVTNNRCNDRISKSGSNKNQENSHINDITVEIRNSNYINATNSASTSSNSSMSDSDSTVDEHTFENEAEKKQLKVEFSKKWKEVNDRLNSKNKIIDNTTNSRYDSPGVKKKYSNEIKEKLRKISSSSSTETASIIANSNVIYKNDGLLNKDNYTFNKNKINLKY